MTRAGLKRKTTSLPLLLALLLLVRALGLPIGSAVAAEPAEELPKGVIAGQGNNGFKNLSADDTPGSKPNPVTASVSLVKNRCVAVVKNGASGDDAKTYSVSFAIERLSRVGSNTSGTMTSSKATRVGTFSATLKPGETKEVSAACPAIGEFTGLQVVMLSGRASK